VVGSFQGFAVALQTVAHVAQEFADQVTADIASVYMISAMNRLTK